MFVLFNIRGLHLDGQIVTFSHYECMGRNGIAYGSHTYYDKYESIRNSDREFISTSFEPFKCIVFFYIRDLQLDGQIAIDNVWEGMYFSFPC